MKNPYLAAIYFKKGLDITAADQYYACSKPFL